jgi:hypothetical protein
VIPNRDLVSRGLTLQGWLKRVSADSRVMHS